MRVGKAGVVVVSTSLHQKHNKTYNRTVPSFRHQAARRRCAMFSIRAVVYKVKSKSTFTNVSNITVELLNDVKVL